MLYIVGIGKAKTDYPDKMKQEFMSLDEYLIAARKAIKYFGPKINSGLVNRLIRNEEAISEVAHAMMTADWRYNPEKGMTRYNFRNNYAFYAIRCLASSKTKQNLRKHKCNFVSLDDELAKDFNLYSLVYDNKNIDPLEYLIEKEDNKFIVINRYLDDGTVTEKQSKCIKMYFYDNLTYEQIGDAIGVTKERVRQNINNGIAKIKEKLNV